MKKIWIHKVNTTTYGASRTKIYKLNCHAFLRRNTTHTNAITLNPKPIIINTTTPNETINILLIGNLEAGHLVISNFSCQTSPKTKKDQENSSSLAMNPLRETHAKQTVESTLQENSATTETRKVRQRMT